MTIYSNSAWAARRLFEALNARTVIVDLAVKHGEEPNSRAVAKLDRQVEALRKEILK